MIKYINDARGISSTLVKFNSKTLDVASIDNLYINIDYMWLADEDGELNGKPVSAGDIIVRMYAVKDDNRGGEIFIIKDEALRDYYKRYIEYRESLRVNSEVKCACANPDHS